VNYKLLFVFALAIPTLLFAQDGPLSPGVKFLTPPEAIAKMTVPEGFKVVPFAAEPEIVQPFAFTFDDRGRVWLCENLNYETRGSDTFDQGPMGRIVILEDTDGDGRMDKKTLFRDRLFFPTGIAFGFGGIYVGSPPNLLFIPDRNKDDVPDGEPEILLDGWGRQDRHETLNSFIWGPDGWLYGLQGVFTHSRVGAPGAPDEERVPINAGVWRFHPTTKKFEVFAWGTSNPWGMDFNEHGQLFETACVIPHLWHMIQGGRYHRQAGQHFNPHIYDDIKTIADHKHASAHGGARFYLADQFPEEYRGRLFMCNIHQHGVLTDIISRKGSGFSGAHGDDFCMANDNQWLGFNMELGPDGSIYVLDWHDADICGRKVIHGETGRLWRLSYGEAKNPRFDLSEESDLELANLAIHAGNEWHSRQARRILQERNGRGVDEDVLEVLVAAMTQPDLPTPNKLRALWTLWVTGALDDKPLIDYLSHEDEYVRAWAIQLLTENGHGSTEKFADLAKNDPSPVVRLYLASAAQRLSANQSWPILESLTKHESDRDDHNLPLMNWFALEPLVTQDPDRAINLAASARVELISRYVARRLSSEVRPTSAGVATRLDLVKVAPAESVSATGLVLHADIQSLVADASKVESWGGLTQKLAEAQPSIRAIGGRKAVYFDGEDDRLELAHRDELSFPATADFSLAAWVYHDGQQGGWRGIVTKSRDAGNWYGLWAHNGSWNAGSQGPNIGGGTAQPVWQHVSIIQSRGKRSVFVDGYLIGTDEASNGAGAGELWLGGAASTNEFFRGGLNDMRIYNRALSAAEVSYLAEQVIAPAEAEPDDFDAALASLIGKLSEITDPRVQTAILTGIREGLAGNPNIAVPETWSRISTLLGKSSDAEVVKATNELSVLFGNESALAELRKRMLDPSTAAEERVKAMEILVQKRVADLAVELHSLLDQSEVRTATLRALAAMPHQKTPTEILRRYPSFSAPEKLDAINTLASRAEFGAVLLGEVESGKLPRTDITPAAARQLANLGSDEVSAMLEAVWGTIRPQKGWTELRGHYQTLLNQDALSKADPLKGRAVFQQICASCHQMHGEGGKLAPDLTGSDRRNVSYILDNVLDPNADIGKDYEYSTFTLNDDRILLGIIRREDDNTVTAVTLEGEIVIPKGDLKAREKLPVSMMPDGLFQTLTDVQVLDLMRYLQTDNQVAQ
jgi:putative membrane-bound dehydrogenase-like protein